MCNGTISDFYCTECGNKGIPLPRKNGKQKECGHLKDMFCLHCKKKTNHCEVKPFGSYTYEDFKLEYELGRFVDGKRLPIAELESCGHVECPYNVNGKCWNTRGDYRADCEKNNDIEEGKI